MALIQRSVVRTIHGLLPEHPLVLVEGPPRCGLSTLAGQLAAGLSSGAILVDARRRAGRAVVAKPGDQSAARPLLLDNACQDDAERIAGWLAARAGAGPERIPRFVLFGGPFSGCGPVVSAGPLSLFEAGSASMRRLWLRGGYPEAYGAPGDEAAMVWLESYAAELAYGSLTAWGLPRRPELVGSLLAMVAANATAFNENAAARALGVSRPTVCRYLSGLVRAGILCSVPALNATPGTRRSTSSPAIHVADTGLLHALLGIRSLEELAQRPAAAAASWASFVVTQVSALLPAGARLYRYASADGAALDIVVALRDRLLILAAARRHRPSSVERSILYAARALGAAGNDAQAAPGRFIVVPDGDRTDLPQGFVSTGLSAFLERVQATGD